MVWVRGLYPQIFGINNPSGKLLVSSWVVEGVGSRLPLARSTVHFVCLELVNKDPTLKDAVCGLLSEYWVEASIWFVCLLWKSRHLVCWLACLWTSEGILDADCLTCFQYFVPFWNFEDILAFVLFVLVFTVFEFFFWFIIIRPRLLTLLKFIVLCFSAVFPVTLPGL